MTRSDGTRQAEARDAGFTLIELLVAMTLLGLIFAALFGGLRLGTRAWEAGAQRADALNQVAIAQAFIRRQIRQAWIPEDGGPARQADDLFAGTAEALRFVAPSPAHLQVAGLSEFRIAIVEEAGGRRDLTLTWRPYRPSDSPPARPEAARSVVLVDAVADATLSYYGRLSPDEEPGWHAQWTGNRQLPRLVRLRVAFGTEDARYWPELLAAPKAAGLPPAPRFGSARGAEPYRLDSDLP